LLADAINGALKTSLETRLGICIYKTSLLHPPDDYIGFTPNCPPHFTRKLRPWMHATQHFSQLAKTALEVLMPVTTGYLYERRFSTLLHIETIRPGIV